MERILLGEILGVLRVLAVNAVTPFHRQDAKDAKKTPRRLVWLRLSCSVIIRDFRVIPCPPRDVRQSIDYRNYGHRCLGNEAGRATVRHFHS